MTAKVNYSPAHRNERKCKLVHVAGVIVGEKGISLRLLGCIAGRIKTEIQALIEIIPGSEVFFSWFRQTKKKATEILFVSGSKSAVLIKTF